MNITEIAAIIGALAWLPHLIGLAKQHLTKPKVRVITHRQAELGFTTYGPIFNLRLAFAVERKHVVVSELKLRVIHESGEERVFEWQGITQQVGRMTVPGSGAMPFEKEQSVLAIKLNTNEIEERFIRFQDIAFSADKEAYVLSAVRKMTYLKAEQKYETEGFLREQEMTDLYAFNKHAFSWKAGTYRVIVEVSSPEKFDITDNEREFILTPLDVEELSKNTDYIEADYRRMIVTEGEEDNIQWNWRNPSLKKT